MDPQHTAALDAVLAQSPTDKTLEVRPPPPPSTKERPTLQRRPSLDGGAARQAAADVAAVEETAERIAQERGYASTTDTLRLVSRLLAQDETICRCRGSEVSGGGTTRQGANERFRVRVESRRAAAQMLEAIQLRTAKQQAAASPQVVRKAPTVTTSPPPKKRSLSHRLLKSKLQGSMAKAAFSSGGKAQATKRFEKHLGARLDAPSCENIPGLENGSSVLCWKNREWVPGHVKAFRERGELDNEEDEVLIAELGKDDTSWKWIPTSSPRLLRMDVHPDFRVANRRRGDFVKEGERVVSAWAPRDEREFWSRRNKGIGPAGTVRRVVPARDAAEVELDGLCCTERYWLPLHALEKASSENEGADVLAVRNEALDRVRRALARIEPRNPPYACVRVVKGRRCIVRLSYEDDAKGAEPEDLRWRVHVRVCGRTRRDEAQDLSDALLRDREKARKATSSAMKRGGARDALARRRSSRKARKDDAEAFKAFGTRRLVSPENSVSRPPSSQYTSRPASRETSRPASRETSRPSSAVPSHDGSLEPERSASDWAAPHHLERDLPPAFILKLGFEEYCRGQAAWSSSARAALCGSVADTVDVRRGQLVLMGLEDTVDEEAQWSCDVDCFVRDVPCRLRFTSCDQELRCVLAWCDRHVPERRGSHSYSLQMSDWRLLGYGSRLEWLTDNERAKLCRALALRLETRHGVPVLCVHPSDRLVWPTAESWCALPHDGVDLPSDKDRIPRTKGSDWRLRGVTSRAFANNNLMLWRSVVKLACGTACSRDFKEDPAGRVGLERWLASARRIGGRIELEARHVPTGASARCVTDIGSWFSLGQLRAPLQWLSRDQQRGVASRLVELGLADPTTSRLRQKVDQCVGAEPRRHESDDEPKPVRKTRVEREALRRVRKERRRLKKQLSKPVSIQKALRIDDDLAQSTVGTRRSEAQDTIGPRRSEATAPSRASRIVEVNEPQAIVDVPPQTTPHATPHGSPRGTLAILDEQTVQTLQTESLASPSVLTLQTDISPLKEDSLHNQGSVQTLQAASLITTASERVELAELPSDDSDGESWGAKPPSDDEGDDDELGVAERHRNDASELIEDAMQPGVQSKQQHRVFLEREKGLLELFSTRKAKKLLKGGTTETAQGKLTVAVAAGMAVRRERKDAEKVLRREQQEHAACKPSIGRAAFLRDVRIAEVRYGTPEARQAHKDGREANDLRTEASRLRREVLDLGRALIAIHDQAEVLWTRIQDLAPPAAGWWVSAFKLLDPDSPEAKVSSEETTTLAVLTQRPFLTFSELQLWEDGVSTMSRHRDAVDVAETWDPDDLGEKIRPGVSNEESRRRERVQVECALCACGAESLRLGDAQRRSALMLKKVRKHQLGLARLTTSVIRYRSKDCDRAAAAAASAAKLAHRFSQSLAQPIGCRSVRSLSDTSLRCDVLDCGFSLQVRTRQAKNRFTTSGNESTDESSDDEGESMSVDKEEWRSRAGAEADLHWVYAPPDARRELCVRVSHWVCRQTEQGTSPLKRIAERNHKTFKTRLQVGLRPAPLPFAAAVVRRPRGGAAAFFSTALDAGDGLIVVARDANGFELGREVVEKTTWLSREDPRIARDAADGGRRRRPLLARALERRSFMHRCLDAAAALVDGRNAGIREDADRAQNPWGRDPHSEARLQRSRGPAASGALSDPNWHVPTDALKAHAAFMAERIALGLAPEPPPPKQEKRRDSDSSDSDEENKPSAAQSARQRAKEARLIHRGVAIAECFPKYLGVINVQNAEAAWRNAARKGDNARQNDAIYRSEKNQRDARTKYHDALDKMQACRLRRLPGEALEACRSAIKAQEKSMGQALDSVEVARLCACWAEACLGARLATEAVEAAKKCLRSLPEPWPPKWRFLLAKAHLTRGDVRPARAVLSSLIADCSRHDDQKLYEKWLEIAGWDGVDEVTALARKTFNAKDDTNIDKMNKLYGKFDEFEKNTLSREAKKKQREEEERKEREEAARRALEAGEDVPEYESVYEWVTDSSDDESSVDVQELPQEIWVSIEVRRGLDPLELHTDAVERIADSTPKDAEGRRKTTRQVIPAACEFAVDAWCARYPGALGLKEANALEIVALRQAKSISKKQLQERQETKAHREQFLQEIGVDELPLRLNEASKLKHKGSIVGRAETYAILRIEEREKQPEVFDGTGNKYRIAKKILDICDTGDDAAPDPNAPKEVEKEPETLEEALAAAAKKLRGVDSDHRKLTIEELQRALFDEDLNPFVTWLTANASTVFSAFDVDGDRTLDYDELVYCISMYEEAEKQRKQAIEDAKSFEEKEQERQDAECLLMAKEDVKPEIDAALDDLGFDLLEQNIPGFDQEAADEMRREAEEEALIKWEVGQTKPCKTRVQGAPASFGYLCSLPPPMEQGLWQAPYEVPPSWQAPKWTLVVEVWRKELRGDLCLGEARISAGDLLLELKEVPKPPKDAATAPTSSQPAQISLPLRVRKNARKRERTRSGGSVSLHAWPPPAWAVAPSAAELRMDAFEGRDHRRAPPKEKNENVFKKDDESTVASEQPNVDEHGNVVVTYRQALGKEKKKRDGADDDDDDGLLRGEVEDYQPLHPDRLRPFTREAIEAEKREKWVSREFPDEVRPRTSMQDLRDIAAELDERLRQGQWALPDPEPAQQRLFVLLTDARNGSTGDLDIAHVLREAGKEWGKNAEWIEPVAAKNKKPRRPKRKSRRSRASIEDAAAPAYAIAEDAWSCVGAPAPGPAPNSAPAPAAWAPAPAPGPAPGPAPAPGAAPAPAHLWTVLEEGDASVCSPLPDEVSALDEGSVRDRAASPARPVVDGEAEDDVSDLGSPRVILDDDVSELTEARA